MSYQIRVDGQLSEALAKAFPELDHVIMSGQTVLFGNVVDEAHLYGLPARCQALGLWVLEMRQLPQRQVDKGAAGPLRHVRRHAGGTRAGERSRLGCRPGRL